MLRLTAPAPGRRLRGAARIAVLRCNGIGDLTFALPALEALRAAYPAAEIVLLAGDWQAEFYRRRPGPIDRVIVVPPSRGVREGPGLQEDPAVLEPFFAAMARERFDLALQLHGGGRYSNPFVRRLGARLTAGLRAPDAPPLDRWVPYVYFQHEVLRYLEVVALVGARPVTFEARVAVTADDLREARAVVPETGRPLVALNPGAGDPRRRWPPEKFAAVGDELARRGARVVAVGGAGDRALARAAVAAMTEEALDTTGRLSLGGLAGLLSRCALVVSNDSGPLHLAAAVGAPTVGIFWCGNLINGGLSTRTRHRPVAAWRLECPACGVSCIHAHCDHRDSFVADVDVAEVLVAAAELLAPPCREAPLAAPRPRGRPRPRRAVMP